MYRCEAVSAEAFVQQLACNLVNHGYWFYTVGHVPPDKDPCAVDRKLIAGYGLEMSKWQRARRKAKGEAKVSYLRHDRFFVLLATAGEHVFYRREGRVRDIRREPIVFDGYSIGCSKGSDGRYHASVKIHSDAFNERRLYLLGVALRSDDNLTVVVTPTANGGNNTPAGGMHLYSGVYISNDQLGGPLINDPGTYSITVTALTVDANGNTIDDPVLTSIQSGSFTID
jgi:hypothetical protein